MATIEAPRGRRHWRALWPLVRPLKRALRRQWFKRKLLRRPIVVYRHRGLTPADVLFATYPRSGTTWVRFMLYELLSGDSADFVSLEDAIPYVGRQSHGRRLLPNGGRIVQSHERYCDADRRVLLLVRDPRSVAVSQYHWFRRAGHVSAPTLDAFVEDWVRGHGIAYGSWDEHVSFWLDSVTARRGLLHLVRYEDLKQDPVARMMAVLDFLGVSRPLESVQRAVQNNSFEQMREKEERRFFLHLEDPQKRFVRSGSTAGWREELPVSSQELITSAFHDSLARLGYATDIPGDPKVRS